MEDIYLEDLHQVITQNAFLVVTGFTKSNGISVNISYLREYLKTFIGARNYKKHKALIIDEIEKLRDKIYSKCRYDLKIKSSTVKYEKIEYLIQRTKTRSRQQLGQWVCSVRCWDTIGCLTFENACKSDRQAEDQVNILINYLTNQNLISDFFYCIEFSSHYHINFFCKANPDLKPIALRRKIKSFWSSKFGMAWVRKYYKSKESHSYWVKDVNSDRSHLINSCWNIYYDLKNLSVTDKFCDCSSNE